MSPRDSSGGSGTRADPRWTLVTCILASSLSFVDGSVTSVALPAIRDSYGAAAEQSAVARTGGLIATALLGSVLASKGEELFAQFHRAMFASAAVSALAALVALALLGGVRMKKTG